MPRAAFALRAEDKADEGLPPQDHTRVADGGKGHRPQGEATARVHYLKRHDPQEPRHVCRPMDDRMFFQVLQVFRFQYEPDSHTQAQPFRPVVEAGNDYGGGMLVCREDERQISTNTSPGSRQEECQHIQIWIDLYHRIC